ncbi:uncharacterized protein LOC113658276 [Tachysurus fulvidraco]|uniref:uncharacterized protein LOC113658276 n=1 Tax=Tachysurus fulvidraco TaxID=1234273 RepID=UPI001FEEBDA5|nr:uncharacterized protein LOC113658276 [Tachysurus fulvidraco]
MMKSLLIFTLSLISGPVGCVVTGNSGGSIVIKCGLNWGSGFSRYICKLGSRSCTDIIRTDTTESYVQEGRFKLYENSKGFLRVLIRRLKPQDAGAYRIGVEDQTPIDVKLTVLNDSCCDGPKTVNVFPGQNISITSNYPVIYNREIKYIMRLENGSVSNAFLDTFNKPQNNRFSISDDSRAIILSMNISNVTEADDGDYLYGIFNRKHSIVSFSFFREIHLQVREPSREAQHPNIIIIIISVCVIVALLLIGGFAQMVYKLRHIRTKGPPPSAKDNDQVPPVPRIYEEINQTKHISATDTELYMNAPSQNPDREIISTVERPQEKNLTYTTVSFPKNPDDAAITFSKEESTEYATVQRTSKL